jgi:hypothetical protein
MEDKIVTISRAQGSLTFPANFMPVCAQNPCPCGYFGDLEHPCTCSPMVISCYQKRLSGPLLDRIDIPVEVPRVPFQKLSDERHGEPSPASRARVKAALARQTAQFATAGGGKGRVTPPLPLTTSAAMGPHAGARSLPGGRDRPPQRRCSARPCSGRRPGDEPERTGVHRHLRWRAAPVRVSSGAHAGADDCRFGRERVYPAGADRDVDLGSTAIHLRSAAADGISR